tara:strand:- start:14228 stop:15142 length:915 start_codon:yes stop_codon:yes gene_type:complete
MSDFYATLGVNENADQADIKRAYRKLSLKHHPDKNGGDDTHFKKISEAYDTLGDREKRHIYGMQKNNPFPNGMSMGGAQTHDDILKMFFGGQDGNPFGGGINFGGMGTNPSVRIFRNGVPMTSKPNAIVKNLKITLEQAFAGTKVPIEINRTINNNGVINRENERVYVDIPSGIDDNEMIILQSKGDVINDVRGDVKIHLLIINNTGFIRDGIDLHYTKEITLRDALVGFAFDLHHLSGKKYTINNNTSKVITMGYTKTVQHLGIKRERPHPAPPMVGNLIISFKIKFPTELTDKQREVIKQYF